MNRCIISLYRPPVIDIHAFNRLRPPFKNESSFREIGKSINLLKELSKTARQNKFIQNSILVKITQMMTSEQWGAMMKVVLPSC